MKFKLKDSTDNLITLSLGKYGDIIQLWAENEDYHFEILRFQDGRICSSPGHQEEKEEMGLKVDEHGKVIIE